MVWAALEQCGNYICASHHFGVCILAACNCSSVGAVSNVCNNVTGYCNCRQYVTGKSCDSCEENAFNFTRSGCMPCNCDSDGSTDLQCDLVSETLKDESL